MQVQPASFAEDIGFARGDVIVEINREPVASAADYRKLVAKLKVGQDVLFKVLRPDARSQRTSVVFLAGAVPSDSKQ